MSKELPLRVTARVVIVKNGRICLGRVWNEHGRIAHYCFPGGVVERGATMIQTLQQESLEKVGMRLRNIEKLPLVTETVTADHAPLQDKLYRGTVIHYFRAEWDRYDNTLRNAVSDAMHYTWELPRSALRIIEAGPRDPLNDSRIQAMRMALTNTLKSITPEVGASDEVTA
jgi:ADP-ribose pyrophosphatase YjhB (NUDIX family)